MALTNSTKVVTVGNLDRFKTKADQRYATHDDLNAVVVGTMAAELFTFAVDIPTMELKAYCTAAYAEAFQVKDGYLTIDIGAE